MTYTIHDYLTAAGVIEIPESLPPFQMQYTPKDHQIVGLNNCLTHGRWGLFDDAGTGKTMVMQAYTLLYKAWGNRVVCIMPPVLCPQFMETFEENFAGSLDWISYKSINRPAGQRSKWFEKWNEENDWPDVLLMSYELFVKLHHVLKRKEYFVVITDEAQKLRGSESSWHEIVYNYTDDTDETVLLVATGTPLHNTPLDGFAMTRLLDRDTYSTMNSFKRQHCERRNFKIRKRIRGRLRTIPVENIVGYKNLDLLNKNLYKYASRVTKDEVLDLKEPTIIPIRVELESAHLNLYKRLAKTKMLEIGEDRIITATESVQMREHLMHLTCNPQLYSEKPIVNNILRETDALLDSIGPDKKVALYAHHNATIETLAEYYKGRNPVLVYGGDLATDNAKSIAKFQKDPECRMMISHPQSGGVGVNLQKVCHYIIFVEPTPIQGDLTQVIARVQRMGQLHAVVIYILKVVQTVYPSMIREMMTNSEMAREVNLDAKSFRDLVAGGTC